MLPESQDNHCGRWGWGALSSAQAQLGYEDPKGGSQGLA